MLTGRSNGIGYDRRKVALHQVIRGWGSYFKYADMKKTLVAIDKWLRRRIRMCIWKSWKKPKTRVKNLIRCGSHIGQESTATAARDIGQMRKV
ncbi:MAG: group II intron maturase-specific domain-containing protein [Bacteroides sp.]|nr:group II intron maturase-specific domain-containing protein [Bacteroides sp.]